ncbi:hypothetical protein ACFWRZ_08915 [Streptomyces rubiginosohelvolus]|uniref:hypothetical protein n=1 Tax=Streptomyces rubiginosohelvolus TaxID=67362 RepID=UPI0036543C72
MSSTTEYAKLRADAAAQVEVELSGITDPFERRAHADEIRDQAHMELSSLKGERDQLIAAAALYEPSMNLHQQFGIGYNQMKRIASAEIGILVDIHSPAPWPADRAKAAADAGLPHPDDLVEQAVALARRYEAAEARRDAAAAHLEAAREAVVTAGGRVHVAAPARPDFDKIRRNAENELRAEFAVLAVSPEERLRLAADAVDQAEEEKAMLLPERDEALNSLAFYTTARGVYLSAGITRQGLLRVQQRTLGLDRTAKLPPRHEQPDLARAVDVPFVKNAEEELPQIAAAYEAAKARHTAAVEIRDAAIRVLHAEPYEWTLTRIAEFVDRDVAVIHRIVNPRP